MTKTVLVVLGLLALVAFAIWSNIVYIEWLRS